MAARARRGIQALTDDACLLAQLDRGHTCTIGVELVADFNHGRQRQSITKYRIKPWISQIESGGTEVDTDAPGYVLAHQLWSVGITEGWNTDDFHWKQADFQGCWLCKRGYDEAWKFGLGISIGGKDDLRAVARGGAPGGSNAARMEQLEAAYWAHIEPPPSTDVVMGGAAAEVAGAAAAAAPQTCCRCGFDGNRKGWKWMTQGEQVRCHASNRRKCRQIIAPTTRVPTPDSTPPIPRENVALDGPEVEMADGAEGEVEVAGPAHTDDNIDMEEDSDEAQDQNEQQVGADFDRGESDPDDDGWEDDSEEDETDERGGGAPSTVVSKLSRAAMR